MTPHARRATGALLVAACAVLAVSSPAQAEDEISIDHVQTVDGTVSIVLSVDGVRSGAVDPASVQVEVDGRAVDASAKTVTAGDIARTTVLVVDASKSMEKDGRIDSAKEAVKAFMAGAPDDVAIGLILFAGTVIDTLEPTTDHGAIAAAMDTLELKSGTGVYDAMRAGVELLGEDGSRSLLVLSDGADTGSDSTLAVATNEALDGGVLVDVVTLSSRTGGQTLNTIAEDTGGAVIPADPAALGSVFAAQADALAEQLLLTFRSPEDVDGEATITVSAAAGETAYVDSAFVTLQSAGAELPGVVDQGSALVSKPIMLVGALAVFLGLVGLLVTVLGGSGRRSAAERRLDVYFDSGRSEEGGSRRNASSGSSDIKDSAVAMTSKVVSDDFETKVSKRLAGAGSALTASEWVLVHAAIAVGAGLVGFLMSGGVLSVLGVVLGIVLPWLYLKWRHRRRLNAFNAQLAQTLGLMAGGLQAGLSLPQAVDSVVREGHEPMAGELRRVLVEQRLGIDISDAMESVGQRMESEDFGWVVMAIRIQREVGGNLAEILHTVAETLREREYLRRQVKALSAEGRLSGYILTGLPPLIGLYMMFVNPEYIRLLYTTTAGYVILAAAAGLLGVGSFAMSKLAKVEV